MLFKIYEGFRKKLQKEFLIGIQEDFRANVRIGKSNEKVPLIKIKIFK